MGAGTQRWWRSSSEHKRACDVWIANQNARVANAIIRAPAAERPRIRQWIATLSTIIKARNERTLR